MARKSKFDSRKRRHHSLRKRMSGTTQRPRLVVYRSARHIYAQVIDDAGNHTLVAASDLLPKKNPPADAPKGCAWMARLRPCDACPQMTASGAPRLASIPSWSQRITCFILLGALNSFL